MKRKWRALLQPYQAALRRYLKQGPKASLQPALKLGRQAVDQGVETLDLALIHEQALIAQAFPIQSAAARARIIKRAGTFFAEAILPMEETHRSALEANVHLRRIIESLNRRTLDLATSNRKLKREIGRRKVAEHTLRQSEQHSGRLLDQSQRLQEQLRHLSRRILSVQEEERKRISRELHDVIAQVLTSVNVRLAVLRAEAMVNTKGLTKNIARTQRLVEKSVEVVHRFAYNLRPAVLDYLGLIPALHSYMTAFTKATGIRVSLTAFAAIEKLDSNRRTVLFRVAQEALTNVDRHAHASRVDVNIQRLPDAVRMQIKDNGRAFDVERILLAGKGPRMGLLGMRERVEMVGGSFGITSAPGQGTIIQATLPFKDGKRKHPRP
jgi:signal transduction histidine kinase